ncbi:hypothetical protein IAE57_00645 [Stenotrophomonas sp. S48]|uniref:hypothetical protein n=1 Tax=unclassified Stenotrophomonas TaxID=196198 RepID=UPI0018FF649F|nr:MULTISPECIES: hypothetical protein [unclassified Stenotrophomonas]MBK0024659.1 hypothetical protein [Stenotrophomonas sp. S48]MBK0046879.1 hypothetical protein [Stenotrophomonas sp. S49]
MTDQVEGQREKHDEIGPVVRAFLWTLERARQVTEMTELDEESVTSFIMSGVSVCAPLVVKLVGSGDKDIAKECYWGSFKKSSGAKSPFSETATGADFALVVGKPDGSVRLAIFQAKKASLLKRSGEERLDVRRDPAESAKGNTQLVMLMAYGLMIAEVAAKKRPTSECGSGATLEYAFNLRKLWDAKSPIGYRSLKWVHYLAYKLQKFVCVPLSKMGEKVIDSEFAAAPKVNHVLAGDEQDFFDLIKEGLTGSGQGWLKLDWDDLIKLLPTLVDLGAVYVVDENGERRLAYEDFSEDGVSNFVEKWQASESSEEKLNNWNSLIDSLTSPHRAASLG